MSRTALLRVILSSVAALTLALIFSAYLKPDFIIDIANRLLLCL